MIFRKKNIYNLISFLTAFSRKKYVNLMRPLVISSYLYGMINIGKTTEAVFFWTTEGAS